MGQISDIHVTGESEDMTAKERLLLWSKQITEGYVGVRCDNFTTSWRDGRLFNAIIHKYRYRWAEGTAGIFSWLCTHSFTGLLVLMPFRLLCLSNPNPRPDMVDMARVSTQTNRSNLEHAFCVAEQLGVARLLDPEGENAGSERHYGS